MRPKTAVVGGLFFALVCCKFPKSKGPASAPRGEEIESEDHYNPPPRAVTPQPNPVNEWARISCATSLVVDQRTWSGDWVLAVTEWMEEARQVVDQFEFTPWDEIPETARPLIESRWLEMRRKATAKYAIEQRVAVSSVGCKPEVPDCDRFSPSQKGVGAVYVGILLDEMVRVFNLAEKSYNASTQMAEAYRQSIQTYPIWQGLHDRYGENAEVQEAFGKFFGLLPRTALLPKWQAPVRPPTPAECKGVIDE